MNLEDVLIKFSVIAGLTLEEVTPLLPICSDAAEDLQLQLKDGVDIDLNSRRLIAAAAALAFYRYALYRASGTGMSSFTAGDVKIENKSDMSVKTALSVWLDAKNSISDLLKDDEFVFRRV